jgi:hypothetical protein
MLIRPSKSVLPPGVTMLQTQFVVSLIYSEIYFHNRACRYYFLSLHDMVVVGAFAKLQKAAINLVMSVRPSAWNNSAPTGGTFMKFYI